MVRLGDASNISAHRHPDDEEYISYNNLCYHYRIFDEFDTLVLYLDHAQDGLNSRPEQTDGEGDLP
jgi:hypothetical protein